MDSYDINIVQGETFSFGTTLKDENDSYVDLTYYDISGHLKYQYGDSSYLTNLNPVKVAPYASGTISFSIDNQTTAILPITIGVYSIFLIDSGSAARVLNGNAYINPSVI